MPAINRTLDTAKEKINELEIIQCGIKNQYERKYKVKLKDLEDREKRFNCLNKKSIKKREE